MRLKKWCIWSQGELIAEIVTPKSIGADILKQKLILIDGYSSDIQLIKK